jgi:hypothetical protein
MEASGGVQAYTTVTKQAIDIGQQKTSQDLGLLAGQRRLSI